MHKHVAPRPNPSLTVAVTALALIMAFIIAGLAVIASQKRPAPTPPNAAPPAITDTITADPSATLTAQRVSVTTAPAKPTVQAWTPEQQVVIPGVPAPEVGVPVTSSVGCQEDNPCWDCKTMGNRICGPVQDWTAIASETADPATCPDSAATCGTIDDSAAAWAAFDANDGQYLLPADLNRPFRVDYAASSDAYPENMTDMNIAVTDGTMWYVFQTTYTDVPEDTSSFEEPADMS
jgi:hypothetical protein